jgi:hypothetical protein
MSLIKPARPMRSSDSAARGAKNTFGAARNHELAVQALRTGVCLSVCYRSRDRIVEVHTIGTTAGGRPVASVYQVDGHSNHTTIPGWALLYLDECFNVALADRPTCAPRPDYRRGAKHFQVIDVEI